MRASPPAEASPQILPTPRSRVGCCLSLTLFSRPSPIPRLSSHAPFPSLEPCVHKRCGDRALWPSWASSPQRLPDLPTRSQQQTSTERHFRCRCALPLPSLLPKSTDSDIPRQPYVSNGYIGQRIPVEGFGYQEVIPINASIFDGTNGWPLFDTRFTAAMVAGFYDSQDNTTGTNFVRLLAPRRWGVRV